MLAMLPNRLYASTPSAWAIEKASSAELSWVNRATVPSPSRWTAVPRRQQNDNVERLRRRTAARQLRELGRETKARDGERVLLTQLVEGEHAERLALGPKFVRGDVRADLAPLRASRTAVASREDVVGARDGQPGVTLVHERERVYAGQQGLTAGLSDVRMVDAAAGVKLDG